MGSGSAEGFGVLICVVYFGIQDRTGCWLWKRSHWTRRWARSTSCMLHGWCHLDCVVDGGGTGRRSWGSYCLDFYFVVKLHSFVIVNGTSISNLAPLSSSSSPSLRHNLVSGVIFGCGNDLRYPDQKIDLHSFQLQGRARPQERHQNPSKNNSTTSTQLVLSPFHLLLCFCFCHCHCHCHAPFLLFINCSFHHIQSNWPSSTIFPIARRN